MAVSAPKDKRFRRAHVSPSRTRGPWVFRKRLALGAVLGALVLYLGYRAVDLALTADAITVTRITVSGNTRLSRGEVLSLLDGLSGRNMLLISLDEWRQKVLASPWVEDAAIRRVLPGTVDVVIAEREPMGIGRIGTRLYMFDQHGGVIDEFGPNHAEFDLPLIDGLAAAPRTATRGTSGTSEPAIDDARAALAVRLLTSLQGRPDLAGRISQIDVTDVRDAVVILKGDTALIRIGDDQFAERLQAYLDLAAALREKVPLIDYVDLRFGERVYVRPQAQGLRGHRVQGGSE